VLREWVFLIVGLAIVLPLLYLASLPSQQPVQPSAAASAPSSNDASSQQAAANPPSAPPAPAQQANVQAPPPAPPQPPQQAASAGAAAPQAQRSNAAAPAPINIKGDAAAGRQTFRKCQACHSLTPGKNLVGPSLAGVLGRKAGSLPNYNYSTAMKNANIVWNDKTLDAYLADPQKVVH